MCNITVKQMLSFRCRQAQLPTEEMNASTMRTRKSKQATSQQSDGSEQTESQPSASVLTVIMDRLDRMEARMENQSTPAGGAPSGLAGGEHSGSLLIGQLSSGHQARGQISPGFSLVGDPALLALGTGQPTSSMTTHDTGTGMQSLLLSMPQPAASQAFGQNLCARVDPKI